ncbi:MAG: nucleotidyltransferase domain-containing protein [Candidatus Omnitrophica bacterium]|nr:nucleotidyltransferase domain-containing protein [Candidatus Omnitrophota bacterium]
MYQVSGTLRSVLLDYKNMLVSLGVRPDKIILFGSQAGGGARRDSDIDVVVVSEDFKSLNLRERLEVLGVAAARLMKPIEAKGFTAGEIGKIAPNNYLWDALKSGALL